MRKKRVAHPDTYSRLRKLMLGEVSVRAASSIVVRRWTACVPHDRYLRSVDTCVCPLNSINNWSVTPGVHDNVIREPLRNDRCSRAGDALRRAVLTSGPLIMLNNVVFR